MNTTDPFDLSLRHPRRSSIANRCDRWLYRFFIESEEPLCRIAITIILIVFVLSYAILHLPA